MELVCRSFRVERGPSIKFGRSNSSLLVSESISSECTRVARYENLSASMRMSNDQDIGYRSRKSRAYTFISKVFSFRKISSDCETRQQADMVTQEEKKGQKKRSSWLPDPERRWPVQGWIYWVLSKCPDCLNPLIMSTGSLKVLAYELPTSDEHFSSQKATLDERQQCLRQEP
ncbi:hypothetical protein NC652_018633 [Populus alba x Populus x berolinensis]|uniref:Uncharacterized protein n=2 Tax=Populus TaxID=3689 RepID=A0ACC4BYQ9_POPAL|nr:hypothetical protein POTOM_026833 [Populus tomentosa]KAJ6916013.1 hypothetical protein NC652_018633 [Populus alba x Populus x berolinensis]